MKRFRMGFAMLAVGSGTGCASPPPAQECSDRMRELVPTAEVARKLAEVIFASRQSPEYNSRYRSHVQPARDNPAKWVVYQHPLGRDGKELQNIRGGGGFAIDIDRCTAEISELQFQK